MAKKVIVGGRIESKEVGGIVTGAAEILDDSKGKKQSVINQETDAELERLDGAKQNVLTFDNTPTEGSNNPVKSGGVYAAQQAILLAIAAINELIPSAASVLNQLADKAFVNSSISTNTATFRGTSAAGLTEQQFLAWANGLEHDLNDYVFWQTSDAAGNTLFKRYKWNGTEWAYEYTLNNSTFTAEQWEAIQSGITALLVTKLRALPTAQELIQSFDGKQDVLTFDNVPTLGSTNPVKSSGIYNVIKAITDLIPAEATAQNQLADKADVAAKIIAAIPSWKGQYDALTDLQAVTGAKAGDMGCVKTTDSDGHAVLTFYQYSAQGAWVVYYTLRNYAQNKPATTGTTGDYPYNGMGRIELQKNIVNGVNTLTQAMLTQQNTIYVIQYDFTLGEDITVPANCVLQFDGGSISGAHKLKGMYINIVAAPVKIFGLDLIFDWYWNNTIAYPEWFGAIGYGDVDDGPALQKTINTFRKVILSKTYKSNQSIQIGSHREIVGVAPNQAGITFNDGVADGLIQSTSEDTIRGITIKNLLISKDTKTSESSGIKFERASQILFEQINISNFTYGYNLNSFYVCKILKCIATSCDYGFHFGINNGNSTSTNLESCYTLNCDTGYELKYIFYSNLNNCAADGCRICYDFWHANVQLISCGSESATGRLFTLIAHGNDQNYGGNKISISGFVAMDFNSSDTPVYISTDTRGTSDRNIFIIDNISIGLHTSPAQPRPLIDHGGDTQIFLNNFTDNAEFEAVTMGYNKGDANLYRNNLRLINIIGLHSQYSYLIARNYIGEQIIVYDAGRTYIGMWNGTNWVDNEGNILDQTV